MSGFATPKGLVAAVAVSALVMSLWLAKSVADETNPPRESRGRGDTDARAVKSIFARFCFDCHAADTQEANIRLDTLDLSLDKRSDAEMLQAVLNAVRSGEMPPEGADHPSGDQREFVASWAARRLGEVAEQARRSGNWTRNRRMSVEEYNFTMQSLFAVDAEFADNLPPDPISQTGFRNDSELLGLSALQMECYLENARRAVQRYVQFGQVEEQPLRYYVEFKDLYYTTADRYKTRQRAPEPIALDVFEARRAANLRSAPQYVGPLSPVPPGVFPTAEELRAAIPKLHQQFLALPQSTSQGEMIVRIRAAATPDRNGRFPRMRVDSGITLGDGDSVGARRLGEIDVTAPPNEPAVYEFRIRMEDVPTKGPLRDEDAYDRLSVFDMVQVFIANVSRDDQAIYALGRGGHRDGDAASTKVTAPLKKMTDAGVNFLYLDSIQIEMLPELTSTGPYRWSLDFAHTPETKHRTIVSEFLERFMRQAYRRAVSATELAKKMELFDELRERGDSTEESLRETLVAVLVSPQFLFLEGWAPNEEPQPTGPSPHQLASRLSYFLWLAPPDETLAKLADNGSLLSVDVWASQAERMFDDPRAHHFLEDFCRQWLRLDKFSNIAVDAQAYPQYDVDLAEATLAETLRYFTEVFTNNLSALDLIDSGYAFVNDRLANHYGLEPVLSGDLQRVSLPEGSARGGLLTQASLLTLNSDGVDSHPVRRGVWLLERLLNAPPPPPPADVPDIDEDAADVRGLSLQERIERHRSPGACQSCHRKIDPWGIAFENFDATGRWRDEVRVRESGQGLRRPVDAAVQLPDGQQVDGARDLKLHLYTQRREQFTQALVHHMLSYALGRPLDYGDRQDVAAIHKRFAAAEYRSRELVRAIVESDAFRR